MILAIQIFGALTLLAGMMIIINPEIIFRPLKNHLEKPEIQIAAVVVRLILGVFLILQAANSRFPLTVAILGWLTVVAAATFAVIGRKRFLRMLQWAFSLMKRYGRIGGIIAALVGGFLVYAFL